jgi:hypothetical protein
LRTDWFWGREKWVGTIAFDIKIKTYKVKNVANFAKQIPKGSTMALSLFKKKKSLTKVIRPSSAAIKQKMKEKAEEGCPFC